MSERTCTNSDHPERRHWHYGFGGVHWCADRNSPLLWQNDETPGPAYARPQAAPEPRSTPGPSTGTPEPSQAAASEAGEGVLRSIAASIRPAFPDAADLLLGLDSLHWPEEAHRQHQRATHLGGEVARLREAATAVIDLCSHDEACPAWDGDNPCDPTVCAFGRLLAVLASVDAPAPDPEVPAFGAVTRAVTVEDLKALPARTVIAGPQWRDEVYQKIDADEWLLLGSPDPWSSGSVVHRGPFTILQSGRAGAVDAPAPNETGTKPLLMTEPYDGHEDAVRCPGCPHAAAPAPDEACSTCGNGLDSPGCCTSPETKQSHPRGFHTTAGGKGASR